MFQLAGRELLLHFAVIEIGTEGGMEESND